MPTQAANVHRLCQALRAAKATDLQRRMAAILLAVNGIDNALEFVHGLQTQPTDVASHGVCILDTLDTVC